MTKPLKAAVSGPRHVDLYDTTLRDGTQRAGISLSVEDKLKILAKLNELGVAYIEGGWPGSNPKDAEFFARAGEVNLDAASLTAFGMTRRPFGHCDDDPNLAELVKSGAGVACIVGKSWTLHVKEAIRTTLDENIAMISDSIEWLKAQGMRVFFDAEHFFDGFIEDAAYALEVVTAASSAGAEVIVLCDTNGGTLPDSVERIFGEVAAKSPTALAGHFHDDAGCGVANSLAAVRSGAIQIQGCVNGYGERCGNADLLAVAADLELKMGIAALPPGGLKKLTEVSRFVSEICNVPPEGHRAYVGHSAFSHKGGIHVSAVVRNSAAYEHVDPSAVGNDRHLLASDLSGRATLKAAAAAHGFEMDEASMGRALQRLKDLEFQGFVFEGADGSFELLLREATGWRQSYFQPLGFRAIVEEATGLQPAATSAKATAEATVRIMVGGQRKVAVAEGHGPVDAIYRALTNALQPVYPSVGDFHLTDYKVRVLDPESATAAKVRVLIETSGASGTWTTVGVSENIIEASWQALLDSVVIGLIRQSVSPVEQDPDFESSAADGSAAASRR